jgi:hypothetical protein
MARRVCSSTVSPPMKRCVPSTDSLGQMPAVHPGQRLRHAPIGQHGIRRAIGRAQSRVRLAGSQSVKALLGLWGYFLWVMPGAWEEESSKQALSELQFCVAAGLYPVTDGPPR